MTRRDIINLDMSNSPQHCMLFFRDDGTCRHVAAVLFDIEPVHCRQQ